MERDAFVPTKEHYFARDAVPTLDSDTRELATDISANWPDMDLEQSTSEASPEHATTKYRRTYISRSEGNVLYPRSGADQASSMQFSPTRVSLLSGEGVNNERGIDTVRERIAVLRRDVEQLLQSIRTGIERIWAAIRESCNTENQRVERLHRAADQIAERVGRSIGFNAILHQRVTGFNRAIERDQPAIEQSENFIELKVSGLEVHSEEWEL